MSAGTHERPGFLARFRKAAPAPAATAYLPGPQFGRERYAREAPPAMTPEVRETLARLTAEAEAQQDTAPAAVILESPPWGPWDRPDGDVPHSEPETPLEYEYQRFYGWGTTLPDNRAPHDRPYAPEPEPYTPDLCADLADLAIFREALGMRTRCHAGECLCGHPVSGDTWGERMVRAGIHLLASEGDAA